MVLFFGFKSGAFPVHIRVTKPLAYHAASVGRKKKKKMKRRETRRLGGGESEIQNQPAVIY